MNIEKMRTILSEQLVQLRSGKKDVKVANAMCNTAGKIIGCIRLELEYAKLIGATPTMKFLSRDK